MKKNLLSNISISAGLAIALAMTVGLSAAYAAEHKGMDMMGAQSPMTMNHIKTQAEAEALKPGDSMSMTCAKCKYVIVQKVGTDKAHVKMMTIGETSTCATCGGDVKVVGTGKGEGKNEEVKHVCSKCGDDAMFCTATKPGSGDTKGMKGMKK
ncbi:MAG: hypothetical protein ABI955_09660 [Nitrospirota bacterium]